MKRALIVLAAVSAVAAAGLAVFGIEAATAALAVSWLCGLGWLVLSARATSTKLRQVLEHQRASRRGLAEAQTHLAEQGRLEQQTTSQLSAVRRDLLNVLVWVQRTPSVTHELGRMYDRLVDHERPMPELGHWAVSPSTLVWMLDRLSDSSVRTILELGSGSSTIWFATALAKRGGEGRVVALESGADYAESTQTELTERGLRDRAQVLHAPLVDTAVLGRKQQVLARPAVEAGRAGKATRLRVELAQHGVKVGFGGEPDRDRLFGRLGEGGMHGANLYTLRPAAP